MVEGALASHQCGMGSNPEGDAIWIDFAVVALTFIERANTATTTTTTKYKDLQLECSLAT